MTKISAFFQRHPEVRSGFRVAVYTFLGVFVPALMGWLADVSSWANDGTAFPSVSVITKAVVAGFSAIISGLVAYAYNKLPGTATAQYPNAVEVDAVEVNPPKE